MKALIVDDSRVVRTVSGFILDELGINYDEVENGQAALEKISERRYDFILLDWKMPVMSGIEFLEKAMQAELLEETKVIFCTTENDVNKISKALERGASEYVMKPFDKEIIEDKLKYLGLI